MYKITGTRVSIVFLFTYTYGFVESAESSYPESENWKFKTTIAKQDYTETTRIEYNKNSKRTTARFLYFHCPHYLGRITQTPAYHLLSSCKCATCRKAIQFDAKSPEI